MGRSTRAVLVHGGRGVAATAALLSTPALSLPTSVAPTRPVAIGAGSESLVSWGMSGPYNNDDGIIITEL